MPTGVYPRTEYHFKICRQNSLWKKGHPTWNKGKKMPQVSGLNHWNWRGGRRKLGGGYIRILKPEHSFAEVDGYILEHRFVVEQQIGRYLRPKEKVHHLGEKNDNRPNMLMAFVTDCAHRRFEYGLKVKSEEIIFDGRKLLN